MNNFDKFNSESSQIKVSLIVGCLIDDIKSFKRLLPSLDANSKNISEIICIISGIDSSIDVTLVDELKNLTTSNLIVLQFANVLLPGAARNIGISKSKNEFVAFIDVNTTPNANWLSNSLYIIMKNNLRGLFGKTTYLSSTVFERCFIAATYGFNPISTVPGTVASKSLIENVGYFIPSVRAGEDAEWIDRAIHFEKGLSSKDVIPLKYSNLKGRSLPELMKKWYRNYSSSTLDILLYEHQRYLYLGFFTSLVLTISFFWNWQIAGWNEDYYLYVPHISKIAFSALIALYVFVRGLVLPVRKGLKLYKENPLTLLLILSISFLIDVVKLFAFFDSSLKRVLRKYWLF